MQKTKIVVYSWSSQLCN